MEDFRKAVPDEGWKYDSVEMYRETADFGNVIGIADERNI